MNTKNHIAAVVISSLLGLLAISGHANAAATRTLGTTFLTKAESDRDVLSFAACRADVSRVKLQVRNANAEIETLVVRFANGESERVSVRSRFARGSESRWIDLPGYQRCIKSIAIVGDSEGSRKQAKVIVLAQ